MTQAYCKKCGNEMDRQLVKTVVVGEVLVETSEYICYNRRCSADTGVYVVERVPLKSPGTVTMTALRAARFGEQRGYSAVIGNDGWSLRRLAENIGRTWRAAWTTK